MMAGPMDILRIAVATLLVTACVSDAESLFMSGRVSSPQVKLFPEQKPNRIFEGDGVKRGQHAFYRDKTPSVRSGSTVYDFLYVVALASLPQGEFVLEQKPYKSDGGVGVTSEESYSYLDESPKHVRRMNSQQGELPPERILSESDEGDGIASEEQASNESLYTSFYLVSYLRHQSTAEESVLVSSDDVIPTKLIVGIMTIIATIFRNRPTDWPGSQFAVLAIVPDSVRVPSDIIPFLEPQHSNINYRFTTPRKNQNQRCQTHAEIIAMQGAPREGFRLSQFYNNFINENQGDAPRFAVLYTWIYPCRACADQIVENFGKGRNPEWSLPTFVGRTTKGKKINPPLNDEVRERIKTILKQVSILLFHIKPLWKPKLVLKLDNQTNTNTMFARSEDDLCDSCYLNSQEIGNKFNCEDTGRSSPDSCSTDVEPPSVEIAQLDGKSGPVTMNDDGPCCKPVPTQLCTAAKGQRCKSTSPCGYFGKSYVWCYLEDGGWEYCCTGECGNHGNARYDWCTSGNTWQRCHRDPVRLDRTATLDLCRSDHKCGFYGKDYTWCRKQSGSWDYCCTSNCKQYGATYDWCSAGSKWQYCKRDLPRDEYSSALLKQCKSSSPCEYRGNDYAWCDTNDGSWSYCCTGDCGSHGYSYDWCTSGKKWSLCKMKTISSSRYTYNLKPCDSSCDYNGEDYAWCRTTDGSWDYCCTETCGLNGEMYDWCTTGIENRWKYCKREELPESGITVTGESCRSDHSCGYYKNDYTWCYTASSWDYCCSSTCGKYNTDSNFCAAGNTHAACCCSEY